LEIKSQTKEKWCDALHADGITDNTIIAENFAKHFEKVCSPLNMERSNQIKEKYTKLRSRYTGTPILENQLFHLELISKLISKLANGKVAGLDELSNEHLKYSHLGHFCQPLKRGTA